MNVLTKFIKKTKKNYLNNFKFKPIKKNIFLLALMGFFATPPLFWYSRINSFELLGSGDFLSPFGFYQQAYSMLFTYNPFIYDGMDVSFRIALLSPFYLFYILSHILGFSPSVSTLLFLFSILLFSEISMFFYIRSILIEIIPKNLFRVKILSFFGAVIYALSPYVIGIIQPGHFLQLILYATIPLILMISGRIYINRGFNIKNFIYLFIIFFLNASAFANFGIIYVTLIILTLYYLSFSFITKSLIRNIPKYLLVIIILFLSNIWWLLPFLSNLGSTVALNKASSSLIVALDIAIANASLLNLFFSNGQGLLFSNLPNDLYNSPFVSVIIALLILFMFYGLLKLKNKIYVFPLIVLIVVGIFISKGSNEPFGNLFLYLYDNFPGFQIFRRPVSKFYWVYLLALVPLAMIGISIFLQKTKNTWHIILIYLLLTLSIFYLWVIFTLTPLLTPFNVPIQYYQAEKYLTQNNVNKILILPGFYGTYPTYDLSINNYYGHDFLNYIWKFSQIIPDSSVYSPNLPYKVKTNEIMSHIRKGKSICVLTKDLGITHIMVRRDIDLNSVMEDRPQNLITKLNNSTDISSRKDYFENNKNIFTIYILKRDCVQGEVITLNNSSKNIYFNMDSPVKYEVKLSNIKGGEVLSLLNNYSSNWNLYLENEDAIHYTNKNQYLMNNFQNNFKDISLLGNMAYDKKLHVVSNGFANGWILNTNELKRINDIKMNPDGTYNLYLILYYKTQLYFYIGVIIFLFEIFLIISYMIYFFVSEFRKNK
jgi:hypothetical protein